MVRLKNKMTNHSKKYCQPKDHTSSKIVQKPQTKLQSNT